MTPPERLLLIATTNKKKFEEFVELFKGFPVRIISLGDYPDVREVPETGQTFGENASLKALGYAKQSGMLTLAEDSGLCCDALEGAPGVFSARFSGGAKSDEDNNRKLMRLLEGLPDNCRGAHYKSVIAIAEPGRIVGLAEGEVHGTIHRKPRGSNGFGYDPIFFYPPYQKTFGEVSAEMKHRVSHRAAALGRAKMLLGQYLGLS